MSQMNKIQGIIRIATPLHCAQPATPAVVNDEGQVRFSKEGGKPVTVTMQMPIVTPSGIHSIPYFPGNDLRGRLRRKAASRIMDAFVKQGTPIRDVSIYTGLTCGSSDASPENMTSIEEVVRARSHIYMGLFGGGTRMLRSGYRMQDLVPILTSTLESGMVPARYAPTADAVHWTPKRRDGSDVQGWELLHVYHILRVDDAMRVARPDELRAVVENGVEAVAAFQAGVLSERKGGGTRSRVENMAAIQAIAAGTPMYFCMDLENHLSDAQVGLAVLSVVDLIEEGKLGGFVRAGCGKVTPADLTLTRDGLEMPLFEDVPTLRLTPDVQELVNQAKAELEKVTLADMMDYFEKREKIKDAA